MSWFGFDVGCNEKIDEQNEEAAVDLRRDARSRGSGESDQLGEVGQEAYKEGDAKSKEGSKARVVLDGGIGDVHELGGGEGECDGERLALQVILDVGPNHPGENRFFWELGVQANSENNMTIHRGKLSGVSACETHM